MYTQKNKESKIEIGGMVRFGENVVFGPNCKEVSIGFGSTIGRDIYIDCEYLTIGEYTTIHHGSIIHGLNCSIGHNCWFGHYTIIDSVGNNTEIGNNVGVGAHSQLWSHMKFGDVLAGCRWNSSGSLVLKDDVWLVGHSITGPITAEAKSMLMVGSVAVKDMKANRIYADSPAVDVSDRLGSQFSEITYEEKLAMFKEYLEAFRLSGGEVSNFKVIEQFSEGMHQNNYTQFNLNTRMYAPTYSENEARFIKSMLYEKAKFLPVKYKSL